jgi:hypothetical protein
MKKILLVFSMFFLGMVVFLSAQSACNTEENRITGLSISGLKRTRLSTAQRPLRKYIGLEADNLDHNDVWASIMDTGILEPLSVEIQTTETGEVILAVQVHDKWSIFPIPVVMVSTGGASAGAAIYDANAFGINDKFFLAALYHSNGWMASAGYIHAPPEGRIPGWNITAAFSREERHDGDQRNKDLRCFDLDTISFRAGLSFNLLENTDLFSVSPYVSFNEKTLRNSEKAMNGPDEGLRLYSAGLGFSLKKSYWDGYLLSQEEAFLMYSYRKGTTESAIRAQPGLSGGLRAAIDGYSYHSLNFRGIWEKSLIPGFRLNLRTGLVFQPDIPILFEVPPYNAQVDILPRSFVARNYAGVSAGLEKYLFKISYGTCSFAAAYQAAYSQGSVLKDCLDHGVMGKFSFYLSRLAIPALGIGATYNVKEGHLQAHFSLGMSF